MEPTAPGAAEIVVSMYDTISAERLRPNRTEILALFAQNTCLRGRAARYIAAGGSLMLDNRRAAACCIDMRKLRGYTAHTADRFLPKKTTRGCEQIRLLTGITPKGPLFYRNSVCALADRYIVYQDEFGAASRQIMQILHDEALARGYAIITCPCALSPEDKIDHILIPELRLAFLTSNSWHTCRFDGQKNIFVSRFENKAELVAYRGRMRFNRKASRAMLEQAVVLMAQAKACHDNLESYYRSAVDFTAVGRIQKCCAEMLHLPVNREASE